MDRVGYKENGVDQREGGRERKGRERERETISTDSSTTLSNLSMIH